ncbi:hypothetical protein PsYK624_095700 [Phanerochaete sordida]|uniref:Uncharacterized protein n=1 Tax=Phanerochaete sordida TaxID=48140 RepID=A0A9P3GEF7_9APHY|nr:hypothetical protein PsYK624_095700 [Phanerochaete sordida]
MRGRASVASLFVGKDQEYIRVWHRIIGARLLEGQRTDETYTVRAGWVADCAIRRRRCWATMKRM